PGLDLARHAVAGPGRLALPGRNPKDQETGGADHCDDGNDSDEKMGRRPRLRWLHPQAGRCSGTVARNTALHLWWHSEDLIESVRRMATGRDRHGILAERCARNLQAATEATLVMLEF